MLASTHAEVDSAVRLANGVREFLMCRRAIARRLDRLEPSEIVGWLQMWLQVAREPRGRRLAVAAGVWLAELHLSESSRLAELRRAAEEEGGEVVRHLLRGGASRKVLPRLGRLPEARVATHPGLAAYRPRRTWMFSEAEHRQLMRALERHPDAAFVSRFLAEPAPSRRRSAIAVARRRPTTTSLLAAVLSSRWVEDPCVLSAVVENPFTPIGVAASLLPAAGASTHRLLSRYGPPPLAALVAALCKRLPAGH